MADADGIKMLAVLVFDSEHDQAADEPDIDGQVGCDAGCNYVRAVFDTF